MRSGQLMVRGAENAPRKAGPWETIAATLMAAAALFDEDRRTFARQRHALIAPNADLLERELIKLSTLAAALMDALYTRGVEEPDAGLAGECAAPQSSKWCSGAGSHGARNAASMS